MRNNSYQPFQRQIMNDFEVKANEQVFEKMLDRGFYFN